MKEVVFPKEVNIDGQAIAILWDDGHRSLHPHRYLRLRCPCATCVDEMTGVVSIDPDQIREDVQAVDHMPVGNYALQFLWSDAHYTGIYTFLFLRATCTCMPCLADRGEAGATER